MDEDVTEDLLHNSGRKLEFEFKVTSFLNAVKEIKKAGGRVIIGTFDIKTGKCAVVENLRNYEYEIIDSTKGTFITDVEGNIFRQE